MRIQTRGNSTTVWLSSGEGVIDGSMSLSAPTLEKILQAVNEKYGTSFEGWSQLPTAYEVGDTVPNWDAYEKIEMPKAYFGLTDSSTYNKDYFVGYVEGETLFLYNEQNANNIIIVNADGQVNNTRIPSESINNRLMQKLNNAGYPVETIKTINSAYTVGSQIQNWNEYTKL